MVQVREKLQRRVVVIESPAPGDILDDRTEGEALTKALRLAGIPSEYFRAINKSTFEESFHRSAGLGWSARGTFQDGRVEHTIFVPFIHISCHGNENGLALTSGEFVPWCELRQYLLSFANAINIVSDGQDSHSWVSLTISACKGWNGYKMFHEGPPYPCFAVVGPHQDVDWCDSLIAFLTYFHHLIYKDSDVLVAVTRMNAALGSNQFRLSPFASNGPDSIRQ